MHVTHLLSSIVMLNQVYISDVVPKTFYNETISSYFLSVTVCVDVLLPPSKPWLVQVDASTDAAHDEFNVKGVSHWVMQVGT